MPYKNRYKNAVKFQRENFVKFSVISNSI